MATSQQQWRHGSQLLLLAAALALVLLVAAGSADACKYPYQCPTYPHAKSTCDKGKCRWKCMDSYRNCDGNINENGCETSVYGNINYCGNCYTTCSLSSDYQYGEVVCIYVNGYWKCVSQCKDGWEYNYAGKFCYKSS